MINFPSTAFIPANGYVLIWADDKDTTFTDMHTNFNLQNSGDSVFLSLVATTIPVLADSVTYLIMGTDSSLERCPNGTGPFGFTIAPTPRSANCPEAIVSVDDKNFVSCFPNPADGAITFSSESNHSSLLTIYNLMGTKVLQLDLQNHSSQKINCSNWPSGIYLWMTDNQQGKFVVMH